MEDIGERLRELGWRQGVIVPASLIFEGLPDGSPVTGRDYAMMVTQSCDLVHHDLQNEPSAVVLNMKAVDCGNPGWKHGRNPRVIHVQSSDGEWLEAWAWNQVVLPRESLADKKPAGSIQLAPKALRGVLDWLAKRFTRIAFPDDFNDALRPKSGMLGKLFKKNHELFTDILLQISPFEELHAGQRYELACYLLMAAEIHGEPTQLAEARAVAAKLENLFKDCGILVLACSPVSEAVLTVAELNELVRWDYDHLTNRASSDS